jgi:hypothetical protein
MITNNLSIQEKQHYTNLWCIEQGIKPRDLGCGTTITNDGKVKLYQNAHPAIDDVIILIQLRNEFWSFWNHNEKCVWQGFWSSVYNCGFPFKAKALKKIELLAQSGIYRQEQQKIKQAKIRQLRESTQQTWGCNMTAKGSPATDSLIRV